MIKEGSIMLVPKSKLGLTPKAFQDYVEKYFKPIVLLDRTCFYAFLVLILGRRKPNEKGVAPIHSCSLQKFKDELPDGISLSEWISLNRNNGYFQEFSESWDDGCIGSVVDYD